MIGLVLRKRWRLLLVFAVAGAVLGAAVSLLFSPGYRTSANVLLQGPREPGELVTEAQVAMSSTVLDRVAAGLRWGESGADLHDSVEASVAEGNIIQITGTADTPQRAQQLADRVANEYVNFSTQLLADTTDAAAQVSLEQRQALRQQVTDTNQRISDLHASAGKGDTIDSVGVRTELERLRTGLAQAVTKLDELDAAASQAKMVVMGPAERPTGPAAPTMTHFVAGGAALFFLLGLFGHLFLARADRRVRDENGIVSALGSTILGGVEVPDEPPTAEPSGSLPARLHRLVLDEWPWYLPELPAAGDEDSLDIRYRRVLIRLREHMPANPSGGVPRVLVVTADDDRTAGRAAARLGNTAGGGPVRTALRTVEVSAQRPTVPDDGTAAGVLVVVTAGTRTAWELVGIAEACADAGHEVLGVLVTHRTRPAGGASPAAAPPEVSVDSAMAGSS
ncbi:exopolysaccharide biosynthesis protein [Actinophytocola sp.]|uniref:exopolysaccharide biosynthesis protein n=1 Tax=Actinophytocola sp. TaxID=1872138 RepID=UPI0025C66A28|nr:exopolysaccharide biosynthesis protein [Actinophytocola sp.]